MCQPERSTAEPGAASSVGFALDAVEEPGDLQFVRSATPRAGLRQSEGKSIL